MQDLYDFASIQILDDDSEFTVVVKPLTLLTCSCPVAVVGLERTQYRVSEDVGVVKVCAMVITPNIYCPVEFSFTVSISTEDKSAGKCYEFVM